MPISIEPYELIVGTRTVFTDQAHSRIPLRGNWSHDCFPQTLTEAERKEPHRYPRSSHNVGGYGKILEKGFGGIAEDASARLVAETDPVRRDFLIGVRVAFQAASAFVLAGGRDRRGLNGVKCSGKPDDGTE